MPIVLLDRPLPGIDAPSVSLDNRNAGKLAASHLISSGHRSLGCLRGDPQAVSDRERLEGVREAMSEAGLPPDELIVTGDGYTREASRTAADALISRPNRPTGIISLSGQGVLGILEVSRRENLSIPKDFSLIAFDEQPWSALMQPPITTIAQPIEAMAEKAVALLNAGLAASGNISRTDSAVFRADLFGRESVSPAARR